MNLATIQLNTASSQPLAGQLESALRSILSTMTPGEKVPSERTIAEELKVSRVTVRSALSSLERDGVIERNGRAGTVVGQSRVTAHEMAFGFSASAIKPTLKLLLFEDIPHQKRFWEETIRLYNNEASRAKVCIEWLAHKISLKDYFSYVRTCGADLFQYAYVQAGRHGALKLPDRLRTGCPDGLGDFLLPLDRSMHMVLFNPKLAEQCGIALTIEDFRGSGEARALTESAAKLPDGVYAGGRAWDYLIRELQSNDDSPEPVLQRFFEKYANCKHRERLFLTRQHAPFDSVEHFSQEKLLSLVINITHLAMSPVRADFEWQMLPLRSQSLLEPMALGINKMTPFADEATEFLDFMLSDATQKRIVDEKQTVPGARMVRQRKSTECWQLSKQEIDACWDAGLKVGTCTPKYFVLREFLTLKLCNEMHEFFTGSQSLDEVFNQCMQRWTHFQERMYS